MKATVEVENLKIYSFHGCMKEEEIIGSDYVVNARAVCQLQRETFNDDITQTVDYVDIARIIKREMAVRSKLLESVVRRILSSCLEEIIVLEEITVSVSKINPPINADVESVTVSLSEKRNR